MSPSNLPSEPSDDALEPNTLDDEDDWKDIEPEDFGTSFVSFGGTTKFSDLHDFLQDAKENHGVDLLGLKSRHGMTHTHCGILELHVSQSLIHRQRTGDLRDDQAYQLCSRASRPGPLPP